MRKDWLWIGAASLLLAACTTEQQQSPAPQQPAYNGPVVEIGGVEPRYEPINPGTSQDYAVNGKTYRIVKDPSNFSETGLAAWYGDEAGGNQTAIGETFDPNALTAAHPTLPLPSYVRVTNIANGRQIVVRVNDRGPYTSGRIIDLSRAAGERLNISNNTKVRVDYIKVAPDGSVSGPGTVGTTVAKQSYALPSRPDIAGGMTVMGGAAATTDSQPQSQPVAQSSDNSLPVDNQTLSSDDSMGAPVRSGGFLGAPTPLRTGVLEGSEPQPAVSQPAAAAAAAPVAHSGARAIASGSGYVVQVGALSDGARARSWAQSLSQRFGVPGNVAASGNVYRVQLGPFSNRQQAAALQQRLSTEAQQQSFITVAPGGM
ncbi:endolytic peptidoglycan transglycosylase RlpA [Erwiniaceae bacterium BAC15a-03b]|uniref:Endolytic peptidoglycan transglycosylase RlpA n=1 Tax=Winslowiella arboricola TaxID=2978220 RepID=A0A9J6PJN3_9GAMM|nr:endolytic peptidoglycan transglycosylase RlpA [Winslowiella arboricola]MCU5774125.1 endolytic peptidoglycan transglycosylase RlpA [Winslowiella arboricola]MCU5776942.1 endolytic peptidoglycan transglycosylase RlpA [Winslowiella arboricola]